MRSWTVVEAKNQLSEVLQAARKRPQSITNHGSPAAVVLSVAEYERLQGKRVNLYELVKDSPLAGLDLEFTRQRSVPRQNPFGRK